MRIFKDTRGKSWFDIIGETGQVDITITYPEAIRAFHYHERKYEIFFVIEGEYKIVVYDTQASIKKKTVTYLSQGDSIRIEPYTWHGYQVLGEKRGIIMEYSSERHNLNNPDDQRKPYNEFDNWEKEKK
jgi:dTDP-4-dehydrorhamnose 3,5-epimerase